MKFKSITLNGYHQFKKVELNLTYPLGHKKEGKPLDKICFIGQSGTGKTSLLRLIKYFVSRQRQIGPDLQLPIIEKNKVSYTAQKGDISWKTKAEPDAFIVSNTQIKGEKISFEKWNELDDAYDEKHKPLLMNFPAEVIRGSSLGRIESVSDVKVKESRIKERLELIDKLEPKTIVDFGVDQIEEMRNFIFKEIKEFRAKELLYKQNVSHALLKDGISQKELNRIYKAFQAWKKKNPDPLIKLSEECLDPLLNKFGLKVKTEIDLDAILALGDIQLQTLEGKDVERSFWSTGTRHVVDTIVPLYELKPKDAVVLMDEPERSLYPDIQEIIVDLYANMNPSCQFFFATHSPIIASSFDPWEVFHLEFDDTGFVNVARNYKGDRHVDNYDYYPKYLRWDTILLKVFKFPEEGRDEREEMLVEVASKYKKLLGMKDSGLSNSEQYKALKIDFLRLANKTGWDAKSFKI